MKSKEKHKRRIHLLLGLSIFATLGYFIFYLIRKQGDYPPWLQGFCNLNDAFTSALFIFGFVFAFFIYLVNQQLFPSKNILWIIDNIPDFLPFKHSIQSYFKKFIKKEASFTTNQSHRHFK